MKIMYFLLAMFYLGLQDVYSQTAGDQEIAWVKNIYSSKYADTLYKKYQELIVKENSHSYRFDDRILVTFDKSVWDDLLIMNGLLYPQLLTGDSTIKHSPAKNNNVLQNFFQNDTLSIGSIKEVEESPKSYKKKRFMVYILRRGIMTWSLYTFEVTNNIATEKTNVQFFFQNASLTFLKFISILI